MKQRSRIRAAAGWLLLGIFFFTTCFLLQLPFTRNSDDASSLIAGYEMFHGNPLLKNWTLPPDNFYFQEVLLYGLMCSVAGLRPELIVIASALLWTVMIVVSAKAALILLPREKIWYAVLPVLLVLAFPTPDSTLPLMLSPVPLHVLTIVITVVVLCLASAEISGAERWSRKAAIFLLSLVAGLGDPFYLLTCLLPLMLLSVVHAKRLWKRNKLSVLWTPFLGIIVGHILLLVIRHEGGFTSPSLPTTFATVSGVASNLGMLLQGWLELTGSNFTGKGLVRESLLNVLRLPLMLLMIGAVFMYGIKYMKVLTSNSTGSDSKVALVRAEVLFGLLSLSSLIVLAAFVFSAMVVDSTGVRYLIPVLVNAAICMAYILNKNRLVRGYLYIVFLFSLMVMAGNVARVKKSFTFLNESQNELIDLLNEKHLTVGYAPYWQSNIIRVVSRNKIRPLAIAPNVTPFTWLSNRSWYIAPTGRDAVFVVIQPGEPTSPTESAVRTELGAPSEIAHAAHFIVYIYKPTTTDFSRLVAHP